VYQWIEYSTSWSKGERICLLLGVADALACAEGRKVLMEEDMEENAPLQMWKSWSSLMGGVLEELCGQVAQGAA